MRFGARASVSSKLLLSATLLVAAAAHAQTAHFGGTVQALGSGFSAPYGVAVDASGDVFVANTGNNAVKEIVAVNGVIPSSPTINTLGSGFSYPQGVAVDASGDVFVADTAHNAVKEIVAVNGVIPSSPTINTLGSGFSALTGVAVDASGDVFVADYGNSAVKEIVAVNGVIPSSPTINTLGSGFNHPTGVAVDASGDVFVADYGNSAVKEIVAVNGVIPSSPTINTLGSGFSYPFGVAVDASGDVFVADTYYNAVKEIVAVNGVIPSSPTINTLGSGFNTPFGVAVDASGDVFVADYGNGAVKEISPAKFGTLPVGSTSSTQQSLIFNFDSAGTLASTPYVVLTQGASNLDFKAATSQPSSVCVSGVSYSQGSSCTVDVTFTPARPGIRTGAVQLMGSSGTPIATGLVSGTGTGPQVTFPSNNTPITLGSGFNQPTSVAVDASGDVFVAGPGSNYVQEIVAVGGVIPSSPTIYNLGSGFSGPFGVAVYASGDVFVADTGNNAVEEIVAVGGVIPSTPTINTLGSGFNTPEGVAVDASGDVFVADYGNNAVKEIVAVNGVIPSSPTINTLGSGFRGPQGVAVDASGDVFVADNVNNAVKEIVAVGGVIPSSPTINTLGSGFHRPSGVAVDASGDVFVADRFNSAVKEIVAVNGVIPSSPTINTLGSGFNQPFGVAVDASGDVFVADPVTSAVEELAYASSPTMNFPTATVDGSTDTTDGTQTVTLQNIGNAALSFAIPGSGLTNPTTPHDFTFSSTGSGACPSLTSSASTTGTLAAGATCNIPLTFTPVAPSSGALSESLIFTDNALNSTSATQTITLIGTAALVPYAVTHFNGYVTNIALGSTTNFLIFLGNPSSTAALSNVSATVTLPAGFSYAGSTGGGCNVTPSSSGSTVTLSGISLAAGGSCQNGILLQATATGSQTVSTLPAAGTANGTAATTSVTVYTPTLTSLTVSGYGSPAILTEGSTVTVTALDQNGNVDTSFTGSVTLSSSDAKATLPGSYAFQSSDNGVHTFNVTLNTLGTQSITATSGSTTASQTGILVGDAVWVLSHNGFLNKLNSQGGSSVAQIQTYVQSNGTSGGLAMDGSGDIWETNNYVYGIARVNPAGSSSTEFSGGGIISPDAIAIDGAGYVWIANSFGNTVSVFNNSGSAKSSSNGYGSSYVSGEALNAPSAIAIDRTGGVWVANKTGNTVTHIFGAAAPAVTPLSTAVTNGTLGTKP